MSRFISVEDALDHIVDHIPTTGAERVQLADARRRVLAAAVDAPEDSPRFDNSAMDGFALRFSDIETVPTTLDITGESAAGAPSDATVGDGEAFRISTGAKLPDGADTVVRSELCEDREQTVVVNEQPGRAKGANIRRKATYLAAGEPALDAGQRIGGAEIGMLVSFGRSVVSVYRRPTVAIISTGDELVELGDTPGPGQIINSNAYMLEALVAEHGGVPVVFPIAADRRDVVEETYRRAVNDCDLVVSTGGVSVGAHDHVGDVVDELTGGMTFWKVRMKPGKPLAFGSADTSAGTVPLIGLPGNPGAAFVGFQLFVRPAVGTAQGIAPDEATLPTVEATLTGSARGSRGRRAYLAGQLTHSDQGPRFHAFSHQSSGNPALFANCNALGIVEQGRGKLSAGDPLPVHLLRA